jgi:mRNA interferase MazF
MPIARGQVYLVRLDPTLGSEIKKTRPCVIVSPDELNDHLRTVIVAPMTTGGRAYPWRPRCRFQGRAGFVALDQLRTVDAERLLKPLGQLDSRIVLAVLQPLQEMFAE